MIHWAGGHHMELRIPTNWRQRRNRTSDLKAVVSALRKVLTDTSIATVLNREGLLGDNGANWTAERVAQFRETHRLAAYSQS